MYVRGGGRGLAQKEGLSVCRAGGRGLAQKEVLSVYVRGGAGVQRWFQCTSQWVGLAHTVSIVRWAGLVISERSCD